MERPFGLSPQSKPTEVFKKLRGATGQKVLVKSGAHGREKWVNPSVLLDRPCKTGPSLETAHALKALVSRSSLNRLAFSDGEGRRLNEKR